MGQLSRQCCDNLLAVGGMFTAKHLTVDAFSNMPVHQGHAGVDRGRDLKPRLFDYGMNVGNYLVLSMICNLFHTAKRNVSELITWSLSDEVTSECAKFSEKFATDIIKETYS